MLNTASGQQRISKDYEIEKRILYKRKKAIFLYRDCLKNMKKDSREINYMKHAFVVKLYLLKFSTIIIIKQKCKHARNKDGPLNAFLRYITRLKKHFCRYVVVANERRIDTRVAFIMSFVSTRDREKKNTAGIAANEHARRDYFFFLHISSFVEYTIQIHIYFERKIHSITYMD